MNPEGAPGARGVGAAHLRQGCGDGSWTEFTTHAAGRQHGQNGDTHVLLNPFCPFSTAKVLALKATVLLLLTLLLKARMQIATGSAIGFFLLMLQTLVFLAISAGLGLAAGGAALCVSQQRRPAAA